MSRRRARLTLGLAMMLAGCGTHADAVCEGVGDCSQAGSNEWISLCQSEAVLLTRESEAVGCSAQVDAYFACADRRYVCNGNVASFPGCELERTRLDGCLNQATADTGCTQLEQALLACPGASAAGLMPIACTATRSCQAHCLLAAEQNVCAPQAPELSAAADCAQSCP